MKRFLTVIAATAVAAAITIPALANSGSSPDPEATFVNCMRTNGIDIPADTRGFAIKQWIAAHESQPSVTDALKKCAPDEKKGGGIAVDSLVACLKSHGLQPPTDPVALKQWLGSQDASVIKACGVEIGKDDHGGADLADCLRKNGANVPAGADGMALKNWIRDHADEPAVKDAMNKCAMGKPGECAGPAGGPAKPDDHAPAPGPKSEGTATPDLTLQQ